MARFQGRRKEAKNTYFCTRTTKSILCQ